MQRIIPMTLVWCLLSSCALHTTHPTEPQPTGPHQAEVVPSCAFFGLTVWWMARCYNAGVPMSTVRSKLPLFVRRGIRDGVLETDRFSAFWYQEWFAALAQFQYAQGGSVSPETIRRDFEWQCFAHWDDPSAPGYRILPDPNLHWILQKDMTRRSAVFRPYWSATIAFSSPPRFLIALTSAHQQRTCSLA
jgi:hypothetical protein